MATALKESESARIHRRLDHPVVDGDWHWLEPVPIFLEYLREPFKTQHELAQRDWEWDEFGAVNIATKAEARRLFAGNFYFGCEADDPITAWAFKDPTKLKPIFSSDISHFDVTDMTEVLEEAYELVEHGLIDEQNFREFTLTNAVKLHGRMNPQFFNGTAVEAAAARELSLSQGDNEKGAS